LLDNFKTTQALLKHFYLTQLIVSDDVDNKDLGVKLALLLYRFDSNTKLSDISSDPSAIDILQKHNARETWQKLSVKRLDNFKDDLPKVQSPTGKQNNMELATSRLSSLNTNNYGLTGNLGRKNSNSGL